MLANGLVKLKSVFMGGVVDLETGRITSLVIPVPKKACILENQGTTLEERVDDIKRILDTNNRTCPGGEVLASLSVRDMENHNTQMIRQLVLDFFPTIPMVTLTEKNSQVELSKLATFGRRVK